MITLNLALKPEPKGRPRFSRQGHAYTPAKTRIFENTLRAMAKACYAGKPLEGPLCLTVAFYFVPPNKKVREFPTCKPDLDNVQKATTDALNGILWNDDSQIVTVIAGKFYDWANRSGRIEIKLEEMGSG